MPLASFCSLADRFESYLVAIPEDRFSLDEAHMITIVKRSAWNMHQEQEQMNVN